MIETRYSIEYIDPSAEKATSKLGKFLIYSILTISIISALIALIFSNLPSSTSQGITEKVQSFISSLNEAPTPSPVDQTNENTPEEDAVLISTKISKEKSDLAINENKRNQQTLMAEQRETALKLEIERLWEKITTLQDSSIIEVKANQSLTKKLALKSKQLEDQKLKHTQLTKQLTRLNEEEKSVSAQLEKKIQDIEKHIGKIKNLEKKQITNVETAAPPVAISPPVVPKVVEVEKMKEIETTKSTATSAIKKEKVSQMDAIVAAMEAANNSSTAKNTETTSSSDK